MSSLVLVEFNEDYGRMGELSGVFLTTKKALEEAKGQDVHLGEVLGKHSHIEALLSDDNLEIVCEDQKFLEQLKMLLGRNFQAGINPLDYIDE